MINFHPNEGVILFGIVQIILGLGVIIMTFFDRKYRMLKEAQSKFKKYLFIFAGITLTFVYFIIKMYLQLPETELASKELLWSMMGWMVIVGGIYTFTIDGSKFDKRLQRTTLFTYLTGKKISYGHLCMVAVGVFFIWLGFEGIFI